MKREGSLAMIISNDIESFIKTKGKEECSNLNIVREEAIVYWHHSDMNNYEAAQREMIQLSNLL